MVCQCLLTIQRSLLALAVLLIAFVAEAVPCLAQSPSFERDVAPLLIRRCLECHQAANPSGALSLESADGVARGGDSGPAMVPKSAAESLLFQRVQSGEMPPRKHGETQQLPAEEVAILKSWIDSGAEFPADRRLDLYEKTSDVRGGRDWWSLRPLTMVEPPLSAALPGNAQHDHPIDRFVVQSLQANGLTPAPQASTEVIVRRLYWDITGLPASAPEISRVLARPDHTQAINELIDALLNSPQFGERWARHWLDVVRFAETCGYERDQVKPFAWKYRDWVVNAFNSDMPYDQFIREQLAGDEIPDRSEQSVIATGFLCLGTWNDEPNDAEDYKYERLEDLVHTTSSAFLGMTTKCARCHDHKFDPIPQTDYYRMAAAFWPGPIQPRSRELLGGPSATELGYPEVLGWTDITTKPSPLHKLKNGERHAPMEVVSAASLSFVPAEFRTFEIPGHLSSTTRLRLQLADWIASERNPLTARVIVNRIWQHHFGEGLVRSSNNFGFTGDKPTHPELLDWLAAELIRNNWSLKHLHRLILTSSTWQQSSLHPHQQEYNQRDSANRFLWRANRRRKEAESLRDAFLVATGELNLTLGGPSFFPTISPDALEGLSRKAAAWTASPEADQNRRSLYMFTQRSLLPPMMTTFDMCDSTLSCGQRDVTIVAPQALTLLNNEFVHQRANTIAKSLIPDDNDEPPANVGTEVVTKVWRSILSRDPSAEELQASIEHIRRQAVRLSSLPDPADTSATEARADAAAVMKSATMVLDAAHGVELDSDGRVVRWTSGSGKHDATQSVPSLRPLLAINAINGLPAVRLNGAGEFLHLEGTLMPSDEVTIFAVVTDLAADGHRELISNWSGRDGNSGTSFFVGMTGEHSVRLSDAVSGVGQILNRQSPFLLTATNGREGAAVFQQNRTVYEQPSALPPRRLDTPWVIGQQGNIDGEYWKGDIAMLILFNRQLSVSERTTVQESLMHRFGLPTFDAPADVRLTPKQLAVASLCLVLFNSNEFAYVD